jgi:hypothetical protein
VARFDNVTDARLEVTPPDPARDRETLSSKFKEQPWAR